jgi:hypothetical protein
LAANNGDSVIGYGCLSSKFWDIDQHKLHFNSIEYGFDINTYGMSTTTTATTTGNMLIYANTYP